MRATKKEMEMENKTEATKRMARLIHDDEKGFWLVNADTKARLCPANVGDGDEVDFESVETQCEALGYELVD
jgi:hypothetical protein